MAQEYILNLPIYGEEIQFHISVCKPIYDEYVHLEAQFNSMEKIYEIEFQDQIRRESLMNQIEDWRKNTLHDLEMVDRLEIAKQRVATLFS